MIFVCLFVCLFVIVAFADVPTSTSQVTSSTSSSDSSTGSASDQGPSSRGLDSVGAIVGGKYVRFKQHKKILLHIAIGKRVYFIVLTIVCNCLDMLIGCFYLMFT